MKRLVWLVILAAVGYLAYLQFYPHRTAEEQQVRELEEAFDDLTRAFVGASRQMGEPGLVAIADPEAVILKIKDVEKKLAELKGNLQEDKALAKAEELEAKIKAFYQKNEIK
jgi:hypothetical protein